MDPNDLSQVLPSSPSKKARLAIDGTATCQQTFEDPITTIEEQNDESTVEFATDLTEEEVRKSRKYQDEALVAAKAGNVIVRMPTGSGKTMVATMLIKDMLSSPLSQGDTTPKKIIFLVHTTLLVHQHHATLSASLPSLHSSSSLKSYYGMGYDDWSSSKWEAEFEELAVAIMTAQIFLNQLRAGTWKMNRCQLIVFDECHNATRNHPYVAIMKEVYHQMPAEERPKILGLTASPIQDPQADKAK
ncbi:P-loop containing nucleoside triphosphate hydrolase protein, partial [Atractiella rhizophila]